MMQMTSKEYNRYVSRLAEPSPVGRDLLGAFSVGGLLCVLAQLAQNGWKAAGLPDDAAATAASVTMIFLSAVLTAMSVYDDIARFAGAGTIVPITGFANAVVSPAMEFRSEGLVTGTAVKMFTIAGPVIVFGVLSSVVYGIILALFGGA